MNDIQGHCKDDSRGFTLVELLTVIVIIGILAGIAIPAITSALRTARETAIRVEIDVMSQALESYKLDHGDYPPDFYDWGAVERHFRKAFPSIDNNELRILSQFTHYNNAMERTGEASGNPPADPRSSAAFDHYPHAIDRAEAIVFCLGGFSKDKKYPFTGQGGPLVLISGATLPAKPSATDYTFFQFNSERESGFFDFDTPQLSVTLATGTGPQFAYSDDEGAAIGATSTNDLGFTYRPDPFPTYRPPGSELPLVYFSSRNYAQAFGIKATPATAAIAWNTTPSPNAKIHHFVNAYLPAGAMGDSTDTGSARPYASNVVDTTPPSTMAGFGIPSKTRVLQFAEDSRFQIISAGLDNNYGGTAVAAPSALNLRGVGPTCRAITVSPGGQYYNPFTTVAEINKFQDDLAIGTLYLSPPKPDYTVYSAQPQLDNITNFTTRTLESDLR